MAPVVEHANGTTPRFEVRPAPTFRWPQTPPDDPRRRMVDDRRGNRVHPGRGREKRPWQPRPRRVTAAAFRRNWWRLVFATVGAVAAVVSYGHIVSLFLSWHATSLDAHLMPIAIDGLIIIGAGAAKGGQKGLGWSAIGPGLAASLYANVMNGLPYGRAAAMGSGWATVALFLATNVMERWKAAPAVAGAAAAGDATPVATDDSGGDTPTRELAAGLPATTPPVMSGEGSAPTTRSRPKLSVEAEAARDGVSVRTVQRRRAKAAGRGAT